MLATSSHFALIDPELIRETMRLQKVTYIPTGAQEFACQGPVSVDQTAETSSGLTWNINFRAVTKDYSVRDYNGRRFYIGVLMSDGSARIIGTTSEAPIVIVTPYAGASLVTSSFKTATPIDL